MRMTMTTIAYSLWKKCSLVLLIAFTLWIICDESTSVWKALKQHEPSLRIFRSMLQVNLILFGTALSIFVWSKSVDSSVIGTLLFQPAAGSALEGMPSIYRQMTATELNEDEMLGQDDALDADYASDGEVDEPKKVEIPTAGSVLSAALDTLLAILIALFCFTIGSSEFAATAFWKSLSWLVAPIFALLLFIYLSFAAFIPWKNRRSFWTILSLTTSAPWTSVTFRDGFIGDILTSAVRPLQDITFTIFYILFGLREWWSEDYRQGSFIDSADASVPAMERSWLVHTVVLPMCMASPLWWRFCQNLRQCFEHRQRWPYLGNAFKYFIAAQVAMFGVFHPSQKQSIVWLGSFVAATLYQVWWDVFMDWELFQFKDKRLFLRPKRLYSREWVYWSICWANLVLRFCWTLSFLPPRYLNAAGVLTDSFTSSLSSIIASAEIIRRTLWGLLRFEWEALKLTCDDEATVPRNRHSGEIEMSNDDHKEELRPMKTGDGEWISASTSINAFSTDMSSMNDIQVLGELCLYATAFCTIGIFIAAYRGTL